MAGEETQADVVEVLVTKVAITPLRRVSSDAGNKDRKMDFKLEVIQDTKKDGGCEWAKEGQDMRYARGPSHNYQNLEVTAAQRELSTLSIFTPSPEREEARHKIRVAGLCTR
jgi:hypothetical protein